MKYRIAVLIPYFGDWPPWIDFFVESCRSNRTIDWFLFSDCEPPRNRARNVRHVRIGFDEYKQVLSAALDIPVRADAPYKLCDVRPALAFVHSDLVRSYDFVGFGDLDVIYGDLRAFWDDATLDQHDLFSSHPDRVSGHLCLMRNREDIVGAFRRARGWKQAFQSKDYLNFDERAFFNLFRGLKGRLRRGLGLESCRCFFREAYSTPAPTDRMRWFWRNGRLTNEFYPHHPFMYLHFMSWHSNRWFSSQPGVRADSPAPWSLLDQIVRTEWRDARENGFMISPAGIEPIRLHEPG